MSGICIAKHSEPTNKQDLYFILKSYL